MDYKAIGKKIISLVGGTENIRQLTHCATRLRFEFYKKEKSRCKKYRKHSGSNWSCRKKEGNFRSL